MTNSVVADQTLGNAAFDVGLHCLPTKSVSILGVVGWCEGVLYLTSPGRPTDIGLQLGKACYPCSR